MASTTTMTVQGVAVMVGLGTDGAPVFVEVVDADVRDAGALADAIEAALAAEFPGYVCAVDHAWTQCPGDELDAPRSAMNVSATERG